MADPIKPTNAPQPGVATPRPAPAQPTVTPTNPAPTPATNTPPAGPAPAQPNPAQPAPQTNNPQPSAPQQPLNVSQDTIPAQDTINVQQSPDLNDVNVLQMRVENEQDPYVRQIYQNLLDEKTKNPEKKGKLEENPPIDDFEPEKADPPKEQDIIQAMYEGMIKDTTEIANWAWNKGRKAKYYAERWNDKRKKTKEQIKSDETFKFVDKLQSASDKERKKEEEACDRNDNIIKAGELIRQGRINEIPNEIISPEGKAEIMQQRQTMSPQDFAERYSVEAMKKKQEAFNSQTKNRYMFASNAAQMQLAKWKMDDKDHPEIKGKSEAEIEALRKKMFNNAKQMYDRYMNNCIIAGIPPAEASSRICVFAEEGVKQLQDQAASGQYKERTNKTHDHGYWLDKINDLTSDRQELALKICAMPEMSLIAHANKDKDVDRVLLQAKMNQQYMDNAFKARVDSERQVIKSKRDRITKERKATKKSEAAQQRSDTWKKRKEIPGKIIRGVTNDTLDALKKFRQKHARD